jgi:hypothetical protein
MTRGTDWRAGAAGLGSSDYLWMVCFDGNSHFASVLESSPDVIVLGAAVERNKLETVRTLLLKAGANFLRPFSKHHRALGALDFDLIVDHGGALEISRLPSKPCAFTKVGPDYPHIRLLTNRQAHSSVRMIFAEGIPAVSVGSKHRQPSRPNFAHPSLPSGKPFCVARLRSISVFPATEGRSPIVLDHFDRSRLAACALGGVHLRLAF